MSWEPPGQFTSAPTGPRSRMGDETVYNMLLRETFRPDTFLKRYTTRTMPSLRNAVAGARRYVLDESMSAFLADLSHSPFAAHPMRRDELLDTLRHSARLPFPAMWIEYNNFAFRDRLVALNPKVADATGKPLKYTTEGETVPRFGWLLEEHPDIPTAIKQTVFVDMTNEKESWAGATPYVNVWNTKDEPLPWNGVDTLSGMVMHGISGYRCPQIGVIFENGIPEESRVPIVVNMNGKELYRGVTHQIINEFSGEIRYAFALLATLTDVPTTKTYVQNQRGFLARGAIRRYLDHTTLTINVPRKSSMEMLARKVIVMARRKRHEVGGHWRLYQRGPGMLCVPSMHQWATEGPEDRVQHGQPCLACSAWRTWIKKHERGDASLGWVQHDYAVTHETR